MSAIAHNSTQACFIGVGVGPGDPELITLKAARVIQDADVVCYLANEQGESQARFIARNLLADTHNQRELPIVMPMEDNRMRANQVYDTATNTILHEIEQGNRVVFLCEGDPLFFASFAYLLERIQPQVSCAVIPGISSVNAASAALCSPLTMLGESFCVVSGRHSQDKLESALRHYDSVVIMKAGRSRQRILTALALTARNHEACYLEYIGRDNQKIVTDINQLSEEEGPYFSLFVVIKSSRSTRKN